MQMPVLSNQCTALLNSTSSQYPVLDLDFINLLTGVLQGPDASQAMRSASEDTAELSDSPEPGAPLPDSIASEEQAKQAKLGTAAVLRT